MKFLKTSILLISISCIVLSTQSCKKDDACEGVSCVNGETNETETGCECDCTGTLYIGSDCSTPDPSQVQALLDTGSTPLDLLNDGVPIDSFYGKTYEGGLIFYLTADGTGMVAATGNQSEAAKWGCFGTDISNLMDVTDCPGMENCTQPLPEDTFVGARIGDGATNTTAILAECTTDGIAAKLCRDLGEDWFLPSRGELNLMYTNLHANGHGGFAAAFYWSSTEGDSSVASWYQVFVDGNQFADDKDLNFHVRAARAF